jgi:hypothetical protein
MLRAAQDFIRLNSKQVAHELRLGTKVSPDGYCENWKDETMRKLFFAAAATPLIWAAAASAMPAAPLTSQTPLTQVRTVCNPYGQCCATGSGQCFDFNRQRTDYYQPRRYDAPPAYGYYRQRQVERRSYYGGRREDYDY